MKVLWRKKAFDELEAIYDYIKLDSPQNAITVFNKIFDLANSLPFFPYKFPIEPVINIQNVRFAVVWNYKIVYSVEKDSIVIFRVFSTKRHPKKLKIF